MGEEHFRQEDSEAFRKASCELQQQKWPTWAWRAKSEMHATVRHQEIRAEILQTEDLSPSEQSWSSEIHSTSKSDMVGWLRTKIPALHENIYWKDLWKIQGQSTMDEGENSMREGQPKFGKQCLWRRTEVRMHKNVAWFHLASGCVPSNLRRKGCSSSREK